MTFGLTPEEVELLVTIHSLAMVVVCVRHAHRLDEEGHSTSGTLCSGCAPFWLAVPFVPQPMTFIWGALVFLSSAQAVWHWQREGDELYSVMFAACSLCWVGSIAHLWVKWRNGAALQGTAPSARVLIRAFSSCKWAAARSP